MESKIDQSVLICALARDCGQSLKTNIPQIEELRTCFVQSQVVVVENDSTDNTKELLFNWKKEFPGITILSKDYRSSTIPQKSSFHPHPSTSLYRISKMAYYRNKYINWIRESHTPFDLILIIDIDIQAFSIKGIIDSINEAPNDWGALFANGFTDTKVGSITMNTLYHDMFAYLEELPDSKPFLTTKKLFDYKKVMSSKLKESSFLPVVSAFGGIGIYKSEALEEINYRAEANEDKYIEAVCEHVGFNMDVIRKGYKNYISRQMTVYYGSSDFKIVLRCVLPLWLFKTICLGLTFKKLKE